MFPGGGSVVAMVAVASGRLCGGSSSSGSSSSSGRFFINTHQIPDIREPEVNCGKPEHVMADVIKKTCNVDFSKSLMVGDRWVGVWQKECEIERLIIILI